MTTQLKPSSSMHDYPHSGVRVGMLELSLMVGSHVVPSPVEAILSTLVLVKP